MTDTIDDELLDAAIPSNKSLIEQLRAQRASSKPKTFDIQIPDWGEDAGGLEFYARMRRIALNGRAAKAAAVIEHSLLMGQSGEKDAHAACDLLIAGLDELYVKAPEADEAVPLGEDGPLKFDQRTADLLGLPATSAREVVIALFGGAVGQAKLSSAAKSYYAWLSTVRTVSEDEGKA